MCGIFGIRIYNADSKKSKHLIDIIKSLGIYSESRGKEASGLASLRPFTFVKSQLSFSESIYEKNWKRFLDQVEFNPSRSHLSDYVQIIIGHTRLATNGSADDYQNNQPLMIDNLIGVHNGIICNVNEITDFYNLQPKSELDTEVLFLALSKEILLHEATGLKRTDALKKAILKINSYIEGAASVALISRENELILFSNTGSLYTVETEWGILFSSERMTLEDVLIKVRGRKYISKIQSNPPLSILYFGPEDNGTNTNTIWKGISSEKRPTQLNTNLPSILISSSFSEYLKSDHHKRRMVSISDRVNRLKRCTKCLLPESHPFISFNQDGICNHCLTYLPIQLYPKQDIYLLADRIRSKYGRPDSIVPLSGGRDSVFVLSKIKRELGLNPVAYSYDWGLVTDLARRNQSRMCQSLGVEHIVISADIRRKRIYVKNNVSAWLKKPDLGIIPLFMAGDKMFFTHANNLAKKMGISALFFGMNEYENNDFKEGFCGINRRKFHDERFYNLSFAQQSKMIMHYGKEFLSNPRYFNTSIPDTLKAYFAYYLAKHNFHLFFKYYPWNENEVEKHIISEYNFELSPDTDSSWRIGDGTSSFYNYIYYSLAGFSESEPMRSNQIREGQISREEGLRLIATDNLPRYSSIQWYCDTIGLDPVNVVRIIDNMPFVENRWHI